MTNLAKALSKFSEICPAIEKRGRNPHFSSSYMTLDDILAAIRKPLREAGLVLVQAIEGDSLRTTLLHESGEKIESVAPLRPERPGPQALGSAITYMRRYSICALLGLSDVEDDDGNAAESPRVVVAAPQAPVVESFADFRDSPSSMKVSSPQVPQGNAVSHAPAGGLGATKIAVGKKYLGKTFADVGAKELDSFCAASYKFFHDRGKQIPPKWEEFFRLAQAYVAECEQSASAGSAIDSGDRSL